MYLHENNELFEEIIYNTADAFKLPVAIVEKDYLVTMFLKEIVDNRTYKEDYDSITLSLLFKPVEYDKAITVIDKVIEENLF